MKKIISLLLVFVLALSIVGCGPKESGDKEPAATKAATEAGDKAGDKEEAAGGLENKGDKLVVWTFTDEIKGMIENYYLKDNPDLPYEVEVVVVPTEEYQKKLDPALGSGKAAPDVFALEAAFVKKYIDSDFTADLSTIGIEKDKVNVLQYVLDVASNPEGQLKGISWQATPGAFFYRRSIAKEYLGTDNPEEVQAMISDFNKFYEVSKKINAESNGKVKGISSLGDLQNVFFAARKDGWIKDNKFVVDPVINELFDMGYKLESEGLTNDASQWGETWFASMSGDDVFGYFLPTWGLHYVLKTNAENADSGKTTSGDWGMVQGPSGYFWGGTWLAMREGSEMQQASKDLIEYITLNEEFLTKWATDTGDFLANKTVVENIKGDFSEEFLSGQNHYAAFADMAETIDASILTGSDQDIQALLNEEIIAYSKGEKDLDTAMADFKAGVQNLFPNLEY